MQQEYIYIVLSQTTSVVARSLKKVLKNEYTHMSMGFTKELNRMYTFARIVRENPFMGGPNTETLSDYFFGKENNWIKMKVFRIPIAKQQKHKAVLFIKKVFKDQEGYRYNFLQPLEVLLKKPVPIHKTYVCSSFVYDTLKSAGIFEDKTLDYFITPEKLGAALKDYLYYSGPIIDYPHFNRIIPPFKRRKLRMLEIPFVTVGYYSKVLYRDLVHRFNEKQSKGNKIKK